MTTRKAELLASLQRVDGYLHEALSDDWGANAFEEVLRHIQPVLADLHSRHEPDATIRQHISALGAQLEAAQQVGLLAMNPDLEREAGTLLPRLHDYLRSLHQATK